MTIYLDLILQMTKETHNYDYEADGAMSNRIAKYFYHLSISI